MEKSPNMQNRSAASCQDLSTNSWKQRVRCCHLEQRLEAQGSKGTDDGGQGGLGAETGVPELKGEDQEGLGVEEVPSALKKPGNGIVLETVILFHQENHRAKM